MCVFLFSCQSSKGKLQNEEQTIELSYISWGCDCASWAATSDIDKYNGDELAKRCIFVEPATPALSLPDSIGYNNDKVCFTGRFYTGKGFPKDFRSNQQTKAAPVFRYTDYNILHSNYNDAQKRISNHP